MKICRDNAYKRKQSIAAHASRSAQRAGQGIEIDTEKCGGSGAFRKAGARVSQASRIDRDCDGDLFAK